MSKPLSVTVLAPSDSDVAAVVSTLLDELAARVWIEPLASASGRVIPSADVAVVAVATDDPDQSGALLDALHADAFASTPVFLVAVGDNAGESAVVSELRSRLGDRSALVLPIAVFASGADVVAGHVTSDAVLGTIRSSVEAAVPFLRADRLLVSAVEGRRRVAAGARLIDVRSDEGRDSTGRVDGAEVVLKPDVERFADGLPHETKLVVFCGSVRGSGPVVEWLSEAGFTDVVHVDGGFSALRRAGAPTTAPVAPTTV